MIVLNSAQSKQIVNMMLEKRQRSPLYWSAEGGSSKSEPAPKKDPNNCEWTNDMIFDLSNLGEDD